MPDVSALVQQMHETLSQVHEVIASLDTDTRVHDEKLDALEARREDLVAQLEAGFQKQRDEWDGRRRSARDELAEARRREDEEIAARRRREDEERRRKEEGEDAERERALEGEKRGVEEEVEGQMDEVEEEAKRMLEEGHKKIRELEEKRRDINRMIDEEMKSPLPPPPTRRRRGTTRSSQSGRGAATEAADPQQQNGTPEKQERDSKPAAQSSDGARARGMGSDASKSVETMAEQAPAKDDGPRDEKPQEEKPQEEKPQEEKPQEEKPQEERLREGESQGDRSQESQPQHDENPSREIQPQDEKSEEHKPEEHKPEEHKSEEHQSQQSQPVQRSIDTTDVGENTETPDEQSGHHHESTREVQPESAKVEQDSAEEHATAAESTKGGEGQPTRDLQTENNHSPSATQNPTQKHDTTDSHGPSSSEKEASNTDETPQKALESVEHDHDRDHEPESTHHDTDVDAAPVHDREIARDSAEATETKPRSAEDISTTTPKQHAKEEEVESSAGAGQSDHATTGVAPGGAAEEYLKMAEPSHKASSQTDSSRMRNEQEDQRRKPDEAEQAPSEAHATPLIDSSSTAGREARDLGASDAANDTAEAGASHNIEDAPTGSTTGHDRDVQSGMGKNTPGSEQGQEEDGHEPSTAVETHDSSGSAAQGIVHKKEPLASPDSLLQQSGEAPKDRDVDGTMSDAASQDHQSATNPSKEASDQQQHGTQTAGENTHQTNDGSSADAVLAEPSSVQHHEDSHDTGYSPVEQQKESHTPPQSDSQETGRQGQNRSLGSMNGDRDQETTGPAQSDLKEAQSESSWPKGGEAGQTSQEAVAGDKESDFGGQDSGPADSGSRNLDDANAALGTQEHHEHASVGHTSVDEQPATSDDSSLHPPPADSEAVSQAERPEEAVLEGSGNGASAPRDIDDSDHGSGNHQAEETFNLSGNEPIPGTMTHGMDDSKDLERVTKSPDEGLSGSDEKQPEAGVANVEERPAETSIDREADGSKKDDDSLHDMHHHGMETPGSAPEHVSGDHDTQPRGEIEQSQGQDAIDPAQSKEHQEETTTVPDSRNQGTAPPDHDTSDKFHEGHANAPRTASSPHPDAINSSPQSNHDDETHIKTTFPKETNAESGTKAKDEVPTISLNGEAPNDSRYAPDSVSNETPQDSPTRDRDFVAQGTEKDAEEIHGSTTHIPPAGREDGKPRINMATIHHDHDDDPDEGLFAVPPTPRSEFDQSKPSHLRDPSPEDKDSSRVPSPLQLATDMSQDVDEEKSSGQHGHKVDVAESAQKTDPSSVEDQHVGFSQKTDPTSGGGMEEPETPKAGQMQHRDEKEEEQAHSTHFGDEKNDGTDDEPAKPSTAPPHAEDGQTNSRSIDMDSEQQTPVQDERGVSVSSEKGSHFDTPEEGKPRESSDTKVKGSSTDHMAHDEAHRGHRQQHGELQDGGASGYTKDGADSTEAPASHDGKPRDDDHTHEELHQKQQASHIEASSRPSWDDKETDDRGSHKDAFVPNDHRNTYDSGPNYDGEGWNSPLREDRDHEFHETPVQHPYNSDSHVPASNDSQTEQHHGYDAPSPAAAGYSYGHDDRADTESHAIPRSTETAVSDVSKQQADSADTPGLMPSALNQVPDESAHTVQGTDALFEDDDEDDDEDDGEGSDEDEDTDYGDAVINPPERIIYRAQGDQSNVALGGNHSSTSVDRNSSVRSLGASSSSPGWGHRSSGSRGSLGSIRNVQAPAATTPVRLTDGSYLRSPSLVRADWAAEHGEELRSSSSLASASASARATTPYLLPASSYDTPDEISPFALRSNNTPMAGGTTDDAPGLSSSRWNPERPPQTPPSVTRNAASNSNSPYSARTPASASSNNPFRTAPAAAAGTQQQQQQQTPECVSDDEQRGPRERDLEEEDNPSLFMPRDVTHVPWHARTDSVPVSLHSQTTLSSDPSSPIHTSLPVDRHEPVIRDSWPPNPTPGGYQSYMSGWGGSGVDGRPRGDSSLSSNNGGGGGGNDYDPFKHDANGNGSGHGNGNNRGSLYNPFVQRSRAESAVSTASASNNASVSNSPSRGSLLFQKMRSVFDNPPGGGGGGQETATTRAAATPSPPPPRRVSGVFHSVSSSPRRINAGKQPQPEPDEGFEHPHDRRRGGYLNEADDEVDERSAFLRSSGVPSGSGGGGDGHNDGDDDDAGLYY